MKRKNRTNAFRAIVLIIVGAMMLSACSFGFDISLRAPQIKDYEADQTIKWYANEKAKGYEVNINNNVVATIDEDGSNSYSYCYSSNIELDGLYIIRVKALGGGTYKDSKYSNIVTKQVGENNTEGYDTSGVSVVRNSTYRPQIELSGQNIWWTETTKDEEPASSYVVQIFCNEYTDAEDNTDKIRAFSTTQNYFNLSEYLKENEVLAICVSSQYEGDESLYVSETYYYNPLNLGKYSQVYVFDGGVYDFYIEDLEELQNLYYYAYIYRLSSVDFMVSADFYWSHTNDYFSTDKYDLSHYKYQQYMMGVGDEENWASYETYNYSIPTLTISADVGSPATITINESFNDIEPTLNKEGKSEVSLSGKPSTTQEPLEKPYYETVNYTKRTSDYDDFESDKCVLTTVCKTSEELYWAVENNVTPLFEDTTSRAYRIYEKAKSVLREIVTDNMTNYEKALSIFDWIANTNNYDYNAYYASGSTSYCCYYLEGLFLDKYHNVVCDGMSKGYSLLCNMEGIDCIRVMGSANGGGHAWNKVKIGYKWYVVDLTWTEIQQYSVSTDSEGNVVYDQVSSFESGNSTYYYCHPLKLGNEYNCHRYFLVSDDYISSTHIPFAGRQKISNSAIPANSMYGFYTNPIYYEDKVVTRVVDSIDDLKNILEYVYENDLGMYEILIDNSWYTSQRFGSFANMLQTARGENLFMGIQQIYSFVGFDNLELIDKTIVNGYTCTYKRDAMLGYEPIKYNVGNSYRTGYLMYITCTTNIIDVDSTNISDSTNRYNKFVSYLKSNADDFNGEILFQDDFLTSVLGLSFDAETEDEDQIISAIINKLKSDLNTGSQHYNVALEFIEAGEDTSNVYNSSTGSFEEKTYNYHKYKIIITTSLEA